MKRILHFISIVLILNIFVFDSTYSQDETSPKIGLSASFQDSQLGILIPIWIGSNISIVPGFGVIWVEDSGTNLQVSLTPRFYLSRGKVLPYVGLRVGVMNGIPSVGDGTTDWIIGLSGGGEYFLDENISFGIEAQVNFTISDPKSTQFSNFGKKGLNTATAIYASVYF